MQTLSYYDEHPLYSRQSTVPSIATMVCAKCQKLQKSTQLATPGVKHKNEMYYGSPAGSASSSSSSKGKASTTIGPSGIGKVRGEDVDFTRCVADRWPLQSKLLGKGAKNPYAAYASSCKTCRTKVESGRTYCLGCAYKANACAMCGKSTTGKTATGVLVDGQKRSAK